MKVSPHVATLGAESAATYNCFVYFCQQMTFCFFSGFLVHNTRCSCLIAGMGHGWRQKTLEFISVGTEWEWWGTNSVWTCGVS